MSAPWVSVPSAWIGTRHGDTYTTSGAVHLGRVWLVIGDQNGEKWEAARFDNEADAIDKADWWNAGSTGLTTFEVQGEDK